MTNDKRNAQILLINSMIRAIHEHGDLTWEEMQAILDVSENRIHAALKCAVDAGILHCVHDNHAYSVRPSHVNAVNNNFGEKW